MGGGLNPPPYVISRMTGREKKGRFYLFRICPFKNGPRFFLKQKIFLFLGQVQILVVVKNGGLHCKWDFGCPKLAQMSHASKGHPEVIFYIPGMCAFKNDPRGQLLRPGECRVLISKARSVDFLVFFGVLGHQLGPGENLQNRVKRRF